MYCIQLPIFYLKFILFELSKLLVFYHRINGFSNTLVSTQNLKLCYLTRAYTARVASTKWKVRVVKFRPALCNFVRQPVDRHLKVYRRKPASKQSTRALIRTWSVWRRVPEYTSEALLRCTLSGDVVSIVRYSSFTPAWAVVYDRDTGAFKY